MGWRPIEALSCLVREDKRLKLVCECGHFAEPDILELRSRLSRLRGGFWAKLADLPKYLRCGNCGSKNFRYELLSNSAARDIAE
jgi:hypothetical protein